MCHHSYDVKTLILVTLPMSYFVEIQRIAQSSFFNVTYIHLSPFSTNNHMKWLFVIFDLYNTTHEHISSTANPIPNPIRHPIPNPIPTPSPNPIPTTPECFLSTRNPAPIRKCSDHEHNFRGHPLPYRHISHQRPFRPRRSPQHAGIPYFRCGTHGFLCPGPRFEPNRVQNRKRFDPRRRFFMQHILALVWLTLDFPTWGAWPRVYMLGDSRRVGWGGEIVVGSGGVRERHYWEYSGVSWIWDRVSDSVGESRGMPLILLHCGCVLCMCTYSVYMNCCHVFVLSVHLILLENVGFLCVESSVKHLMWLLQLAATTHVIINR